MPAPWGLLCFQLDTLVSFRITLLTTFILPEKAITICTSQKRSLTCSSPGSTIAVTNVFWGRKSQDICPSDDGDENVDCDGSKETPGIVRGMCEGKASCQLEAKHKLLQNPSTRHCPGNESSHFVLSNNFFTVIS